MSQHTVKTTATTISISMAWVELCRTGGVNRNKKISHEINKFGLRSTFALREAVFSSV